MQSFKIAAFSIVEQTGLNLTWWQTKKTEAHMGRENLSTGFPSKPDSIQSPQLQRLSRKLKFYP